MNDVEIRSISESRAFTSHCVTLIRNQMTGHTLFWHRSEQADPHEAIMLWGKAVGSAFGTFVEIWIVDSAYAHIFFPRPDTWPPTPRQS